MRLGLVLRTFLVQIFPKTMCLLQSISRIIMTCLEKSIKFKTKFIPIKIRLNMTIMIENLISFNLGFKYHCHLQPIQIDVMTKKFNTKICKIVKDTKGLVI